VERLAQLESAHAEAHEHHCREIDAAHERIGAVQRAVEEDHPQRISELQKILREHQENHIAASDRFVALEQELVDRHASMHGELQNARGETLGSTEARITALERWVGQPMDKDNGLSRPHYTVDARLGFVEKALGDATLKHVQWMDLANSAHAELSNVHSRLSAETAAREDNHAALEDRITKEREHLKERVDYLEHMIGEEHRRLWDAIDQHTHDSRTHHAQIDAGRWSSETADMDGGVAPLTPSMTQSAVVVSPGMAHERQPSPPPLPPDASPISENASRSTLSTAALDRGSPATPPMHRRTAPQGPLAVSGAMQPPVVGVWPGPQARSTLPQGAGDTRMQPSSSQQALVPMSQPPHAVAAQPRPSAPQPFQQHQQMAWGFQPQQRHQAPPVAQASLPVAQRASSPMLQHSLSLGAGACARALAASSSRDAFAAMDRDHDGKVSRAEWNMAVSGAAQSTAARPMSPVRTSPLQVPRTPPMGGGRQTTSPSRAPEMEPIVHDPGRHRVNGAGGLIERV